MDITGKNAFNEVLDRLLVTTGDLRVLSSSSQENKQDLINKIDGTQQTLRGVQRERDRLQTRVLALEKAMRAAGVAIPEWPKPEESQV